LLLVFWFCYCCFGIVIDVPDIVIVVPEIVIVVPDIVIIVPETPHLTELVLLACLHWPSFKNIECDTV
jgi:hypothetical protein